MQDNVVITGARLESKKNGGTYRVSKRRSEIGSLAREKKAMTPMYSSVNCGSSLRRMSTAIPQSVVLYPCPCKRCALARVTCIQTSAARTLQIVRRVVPLKDCCSSSRNLRIFAAGITKRFAEHCELSDNVGLKFFSARVNDSGTGVCLFEGICASSCDLKVDWSGRCLPAATISECKARVRHRSLTQGLHATSIMYAFSEVLPEDIDARKIHDTVMYIDTQNKSSTDEVRLNSQDRDGVLHCHDAFSEEWYTWPVAKSIGTEYPTGKRAWWHAVLFELSVSMPKLIRVRELFEGQEAGLLHVREFGRVSQRKSARYRIGRLESTCKER